jgi:hypothetical protein
MNRRGFLEGTLFSAASLAAPLRQAIGGVLSPSMRVAADVDAVTGDGRSITLPRAAVQELGDALRGNVLLPGHDAYERARHIRNPSIDRHPALIVQCAGVADVSAAVDFARESSLLLAVKCGGHSHSGKSTCDGGMMIDLSHLRSVRVDPRARVAHVSGGSLLGDMDHETMALGLVTTAGTVSHTGVGGLTLGGGFGRLARRYGLSLDNVRSFDVVTPDGVLRRADAEDNADLYWALRGGGGNFGVVTSFEFDLHPMQREVIGGAIIFPMSAARDLLEFYAQYAPEAPDELSLDYSMIDNDQMTSVFGPGGVAGFSVCYSGPQNRFDSILQTLRSLGSPVFEDIRTVDYVELQRSGDDTDTRIGSYTKSGFSAELTPAFIEAIVDGFSGAPGRGTTFAFQQVGGAVARVAPEATAFAHRDIALVPLLVIDWPMGARPQSHIAWLREYWASIEPHTQGFYVNDLVDETQYDPGNLFRLNANIMPSV